MGQGSILSSRKNLILVFIQDRCWSGDIQKLLVFYKLTWWVFSNYCHTEWSLQVEVDREAAMRKKTSGKRQSVSKTLQQLLPVTENLYTCLSCKSQHHMLKCIGTKSWAGGGGEALPPSCLGQRGKSHYMMKLWDHFHSDRLGEEQHITFCTRPLS